MREYGKVFSQFWGSDDVKALTEDGRTLALYLLTCHHGTIAGVFLLPDGYVCEDIRWTQQRVAEGFAELFVKGFAYRCETTKWVWIAKHFDWNRPENPNQWKAARKIADRIPDKCTWKAEFLAVFAQQSGDKPPEEPEPSANPSATVLEPVSVSETVTEGKKPPTRRQAKARTAISPDHALDDGMREAALKRYPDCDVEEMHRQFVAHHVAKGTLMASWRHAWTTWLGNAERFGYPKRRAASNGIHAGVVMR